jgi:N-acetylmuramoyl-L-alanine amidase
MLKLVLDPGHGGLDSGAVGTRTGLLERDVALWTVSRIAGNLRRDPLIDVTLTHTGPGGSLAERAVLSNQIGADLFLSIHCNAHTSGAAHGFEVWTSPGRTGADLAATLIYKSIENTFPEVWGRQDRADDDPDKEAKFYVLMHTLAPAVLVEMAFITNFSEEILLGTDVWRWRYADAITRGIETWIKSGGI